MAYERTNWIAEETPLSADNFNNIEDGIEELQSEKEDKVEGKGLSTNDYTDAEKTKLAGIAAGAEVNQNAFSNVAVSGQTTVSADSKTDTLTFVAGSNVTLTTDATNDKVTIAAKDTTYSAATTSAAGLMSAADKTKLNGIATEATKNTNASLIDLIYPVGSIYMSVSSTNPGTVFGRGTWVAWGSGKVPVGVNSSDTSFSTVEKTGGSKNSVVPYHNHSFTGSALPTHNHSFTGSALPTHDHTFTGSALPTHDHTFTGSQMATHNHTQNAHSHSALGPDVWAETPRFVVAGSTLTNDEGGNLSGTGYVFPRINGSDVPFATNTKTDKTTATNVAASAGTPSGTISAKSAGTPSGTISAKSAGTPSGTVGAKTAGTPSGTVGYAGTSGNATNANLQPYITCYMWKRTA